MTRRLRIDDLAEIAVPEHPALSPDGSQVVYVLRTQDVAADRPAGSLWRVATSGGEPVQLTRGTADGAPAWSPDGTQLAFLRAGDSPAQLWLLPATGGEPEQVTTLPCGAGRPVWSPDGTRIAFTAPVQPDAEPDADPAERAAAPVVADRLDYQADGSGLLTVRMHLHVLDLDGRTTRQVTTGDWHAGDPAWSPDGTRLAFAAALDDDADLTFHSAVHAVDADSHSGRPQLVGFTDGVAATVTWTANGAALLVVGAAGGPTDQAGLYVLPASGAEQTPVPELQDLAAPLDRNVMPGGPAYPGAVPQLAGDDVLFCANDHGCTQLFRVPLSGSEPQLLIGGGDRVVSGLSVVGDTAVLVRSDATSFGELVALDLAAGTERVLTSHGAPLADVDWFAREPREFAIADGTTVEGWLIRDPQRSGPAPLLLDIHGGPHNSWNGAADAVHLYHQELVARGWAVLLLNPRGSDGYGRKFFTAAVGAWGEADAQDFLEPLDILVREGVADRKRLAVAGYSYGGFMTCYLTAHDDRFAAAVTGGVCCDLTSMSGSSDGGHLLAQHELLALPWRDAERLAQLSPIAHVANVQTPTLILQGADDVRCPVGQAEQWHTALRERRVPTRLVLYPGASHLMIVTGRPSHRIDFNRRILDWVEQYAGDARGPRKAPLDAQHWQHRLTDLARRHKVPGAQLGILRLGDGTRPDEMVEAATGVLNLDTGVEVTTESLFQIGSITKVWTATVIMQLVDEGKLELDAPVVEVLPELRLQDPDVTKQVTVWHLLTHTSGIDGDIFDDTGRGDDCLEKYVALLADAAQNHPLGVTWSYCNSGFVLLGRVIEKVTGQTWDAALRERLFTPLGLDHTVTLPEEALLHRAAVGHVAESGQEPTRAPVWGLPRALGPAGLISSTARDVLGFARLHLTGGAAPDGTRVLGETSAAAMADKHADLPDPYSLGDSWGLGWIRFDWSGTRLIGHDGNTIGQAAFLRLLPEQGLAVTMLTNGGNARDLYEQLYREIFADVAGVEMSHPLTPPQEPFDADITPWLGTYERASVRMEVLADGDGARLRTTITGPLAALVPDPTEEHPLTPVAKDLFVMREPGSETWQPVTFYTLATGERYLHSGVRATPKVS